MNKAALLILSLLISACSFESKPPQRVTDSTEIPLRESEFSLPISVQANEIKQLLQQTITENSKDGLLFKEEGRSLGEDISLNTNVKSRGELSVFAKEDVVEIQMPLSADLRVFWKKCKDVKLAFSTQKVCARANKGTNLQFTAIVRFKPQLNADYILDPNVDLDYTFDQKIKFELGPVSLSLTSITQKALDKHMAGLESKLNDTISGKLNVKAKVQKIWDNLQKPIRVVKDKNIWLKSSLTSLHATPIFTENNTVNLGIGFNGKFELVLAETVPDDAGLKPLPPLQPALPSSGFMLSVPFQAEYGELEIQANKLLKGHIIEHKKNKLTINQVTLYKTTGDRLVIGVNVKLDTAGKWFSTKGWIYVLGVPQFDRDKQELAIRNIDYDVDTQSTIVDAAAWVAEPFVKEKIEQSLKFNIKEKLDSAKEKANQTLKEVALNDFAKLQGELKQFDVADIIVQGNGVVLIALANGEMKLHLSDLTPP